jgi:hypothetical protein
MNYQSHDNNLQYLWFLEMGMSIDQLYNNKQSYFLPLHTLSGLPEKDSNCTPSLCTTLLVTNKKVRDISTRRLTELDNKLIELTELL